MYMLRILEIIDIFFFNSQRRIIERLSARKRTPEAPITSTPEEPMPPTDAVSLFLFTIESYFKFSNFVIAG